MEISDSTMILSSPVFLLKVEIVSTTLNLEFTKSGFYLLCCLSWIPLMPPWSCCGFLLPAFWIHTIDWFSSVYSKNFPKLRAVVLRISGNMYSQINFLMTSDNDSSSKQKPPHLPSPNEKKKGRWEAGRKKICASAFYLVIGGIWGRHIFLGWAMLLLWKLFLRHWRECGEWRTVVLGFLVVCLVSGSHDWIKFEWWIWDEEHGFFCLRSDSLAYVASLISTMLGGSLPMSW